MLPFFKYYFSVTVLLFITELFIANYMHDTIIRPYGGDFLAIILIYCCVKSFFNFPVIKTAVGVLIFSYAVEISQYFHFIKLIGWEHAKIARMILGTSFSFTDLLTYTLGLALVIIVETWCKKQNKKWKPAL